MYRWGIVFFLLLMPNLAAQDDTDDDDIIKRSPDGRYVWRRNHDRNGIGKFYMQREIAHVTGGINWLERPEREREERLSLLIKSLKLKPGDRVADIGAGAGVISMLMAEQVLDTGYVLAIDVQDQMLQRLQQNARAKGLTNVIPIRGSQN